MPDEPQTDVSHVIYVGPNSPKLGVQHLKIYQGIPNDVKNASLSFPALRALFRPISEWPSIKDEVMQNKNGSIKHVVDSLNAKGVL